MKKKLFLASGFLALSTLASADPHFAGTYTREPPPPPANRPAADPTVKIVITREGSNYSISESTPFRESIQSYTCDATGACARIAHERKMQVVTVSVEGNDLVVTSDNRGQKVTQVRYHLSPDGKTLSIDEYMGYKQTGQDFHRAD